MTAFVPWQLEIHHIDVKASGDATLVIAREVAPLAGLAPRIRSALIDGGRREQAAALHAYIGQQIGAGNTLSVMIVTHYDMDHVNGITRLLLKANRYANTRIYDQGWPAAGLDNTYLRYIRAINGRNDNGQVLAAAGWGGRTRVTNRVLSGGAAPTMVGTAKVGPPAVPAAVATIDQAANWLLTLAAPAEILWAGVAGGVPVGAPTMRFIAANRYVRTVGGGIAGPIGGLGVDPRNEMSLAVEVTFGSFRYYVGGDIETAQENSIQTLLNNANNAAGRVLAMKTSHHGANTATSRAFAGRLRPEAAFISCGTSNQYDHPAQETINVLDGFLANPTGAAPVPAHAAVPPAPPNRPIDHYLTGYQDPFPLWPDPPEPRGHAGDAGLTAGDPGAFPIEAGHVRVIVSAAQSASDVRGGLYLGVQAAANAAATTGGVPGVMVAAAAATAAAAAAEAALSSGAAPAASAFLTSAGLAVAAVAAATAATAAINLPATGAETATAVTLAAMGAGAPGGPAAGAGAAAGTAVGGVGGPSLRDAVTAALTRAGLGEVAAGAAGVAAAALAAPAVGQFNVRYHHLDAVHNPQVITHV